MQGSMRVVAFNGRPRDPVPMYRGTGGTVEGLSPFSRDRGTLVSRWRRFVGVGRKVPPSWSW